MNSTPTRRGSTVDAPEMEQVEDLPLAEQDLTGTPSASGMLQDAQAALEDLSTRITAAEQDKSILIAKIKCLLEEASQLRLQAAVSDTQALRDRMEGLMRQIRYLMTLPKYEEYLGKVTLFEAEARGFRQAKFTMEHENEVLRSHLRTTRLCYSTELKHAWELLQSQREMTKKALHDYASVEAKNSKLETALNQERVKISELETALDQERVKISELHMYFNQRQERDHATNEAFSMNLRRITGALENITESGRINNQHLGIVDRTLQGWSGKPVDDPPPPEPRRR